MSAHPSDTRNDLIEAALYCFVERGYDGTSLRTIAQRAGRPLSLIGHHFGGKEGLYLEVFRSITSTVFSAMQKEESVPPQDKPAAARRFKELVHVLYAESHPEDSTMDTRNRLARKLFLSEMQNPRPEILELIQTQSQPWADRMKDCIRVLRPDLSEAEIILLGTSLVGQISGQSLLEGVGNAIWRRHGFSAFESAEWLADFNLQGLGIPPGPPLTPRRPAPCRA